MQADLTQALTAARIAYCASVMCQQAEPLLQHVRRAGGKNGGKHRNNEEQPPTKVDIKPAAAKEKAKQNGSTGGVKRKGGVDTCADDNMRVTRSRK